MTQKLMVIAPHCDDAELGAGGHIAKRVKAGWEVLVVVGTIGSVTFLHSGEDVKRRTRTEELEASMDVLGVKHWSALTLDKDGALHTIPKNTLVAALDSLQNEFKPDEVLIPLPSAHQDHTTIWEASIASCRPTPFKHSPSLVAAYEYPLTGWGAGADASSFRGGMYSDITDVMETKIAALYCYGSQMRGENAQISVEGSKALARLRGIESNTSYAELFHILRLTC